MPSLPQHLTAPNPNLYLSNNFITLDFETDGFPLDPKASVVLTGWKRYGKDYVYHFGDEYSLVQLMRELRTCDYVVAQNAKFELQWLARAGYDIGSLCIADTMLAEYCILGNRRGPKDLDSLGVKYVKETKGHLVSSLFAGGAASSDIPRRWLLDYNRQDVELTERVWEAQRSHLAEHGLFPVFYTRCLTTVPLAEIESRGLYLDRDKVEVKLQEVELEHVQLLENLNKLAGGINFNSPKQVGTFLYDTLGFAEITDHRGEVSRTDSGARRTDEGAIGALNATSDPQRQFKSAFLSYRKVDKALGNLRKMQEACRDDGGLIYATFNQAVTKTHRLSSSGGKYRLQFQNFDRDFKSLFRARNEGWGVGESDGKQLEFRVAVHLGRDEQGLEDVRANFDVHRNTASVMLAKPMDKVSSAERTDAKPDTFGPLYAKTTGSPRLRAYIKAFRERYNGIYETQRGWTYDVLKQGKLRTQSGLIFYWPGTKQSSRGYIDNTTSIFNYPIQSLATADIIPISLVYLWHLMKEARMQSFLVSTVHDSIVAEVAPGEGELFKSLCREAFTSYVFDYLEDVYGIRFTCPLGCETKVGSHWSGHEILEDNYDLDPEKHFV